MKITVKNANVITTNRNSSANNYDWVDYSFDGDYEYASASGDDYEYAIGKKKDSTKSTPADKPTTDKKSFKDKTFKEKRQGFGQKIGNAGRKFGSAIRQAVTWIGQHKTRKDARKLKKEQNKEGKNEFKDNVPPVVPAKINGGRDDGFARANPDGSRTEFAPGEVAKAQNGKTYANVDLNKEGKNTIENGELVKVIPETAVQELTTTEGTTIPFHKDDVIDKDAPDDGGKGMNPTTKKILIGSAIAVGVGILIFAVYKLSKRGKK